MASGPSRSDFAFPFRIDPLSGQAARSPYAQHVDEMIRQVLLTTPGERADLPEFGCGLRQLVFAPNTKALRATAQLLIQQSLNRWLGDQIDLKTVAVENGIGDDDAQVLVQIEYVLVETQTLQTSLVRVQ